MIVCSISFCSVHYYGYIRRIEEFIYYYILQDKRRLTQEQYEKDYQEVISD